VCLTRSKHQATANGGCMNSNSSNLIHHKLRRAESAGIGSEPLEEIRGGLRGTRQTPVLHS